MEVIIIKLQMSPMREEEREVTGRWMREKSPQPPWHSFLLCGIPASFNVHVLVHLTFFYEVNLTKLRKPSV